MLETGELFSSRRIERESRKEGSEYRETGKRERERTKPAHSSMNNVTNIKKEKDIIAE